MDFIALLLFPSRRFATVTLIGDLIVIAGVLIWWTGNWLWLPAVILCMAMAWMIDRWML